MQNRYKNENHVLRKRQRSKEKDDPTHLFSFFNILTFYLQAKQNVSSCYKSVDASESSNTMFMAIITKENGHQAQYSAQFKKFLVFITLVQANKDLSILGQI